MDVISLDFCIKPTTHQHDRRLHCLHPQAPALVYYASHTFTSIQYLNEMIGQLTCSADLLTHYLFLAL
jgi:hypothetical protein